MTLGGVTLTLLQTCAPSSGPADLTTHFFAEFDASKDGSFGSHDFSHLRPRFQRACPCSHVRYKPMVGPELEGTPWAPRPPSNAQLPPRRLTGAAVQLSWELRTSRGRRVTSTEVHFGQLEVLECLWPRGASEPEYAEVRAERQGKRGRAWRRGRACGAWPPLHLPFPSQILSFPSSLGSQASTQPCAHLRHTQTLRRVSKVTAPPSPALASFPWGVPPSGPLWGLPVPALHPPHLCSNQDPQTHLGHPHTILLALFPPSWLILAILCQPPCLGVVSVG